MVSITGARLSIPHECSSASVYAGAQDVRSNHSVYADETKRLMLNHAFTFVGSVIFLVGTTNLRSRKALEKIGAVLTDRRDMRTLHGNTVEHVVYQIHKLR